MEKTHENFDYLFAEWAYMFGTPADAQRILDNFVQSGEYPEEFHDYTAGVLRESLQP